MKTWLAEFGGRGAFIVAVLSVVLVYPPVTPGARVVAGMALGFALYVAGYSHGRYGE